jgi:class 3 adenylate cyclase
MYYFVGDPGTPYYAGFILTVVGFAGGARFTWPFYAANLALTIIPFVAIGILHHGANTHSYFLLNTLFLVSVAAIMTVSRWFNENLQARELDLRMKLADEIANRNMVIQMKTEQALQLHALSRQFSPQIISALQTGSIRLDGAVHRAEICAIFVDIVGSTEKFIRLDRDDLQKILALYMEDVMGTFLKYDITIDKFLGDGVFGFSNDPVKYPDYIERVVHAALEIQRRIAQKIETYNRYWLAEFQISIGIATGFASVGFYGSDLHVKSYTAIGRVINLAARLGTFAQPDQILVSQDVLAKLQEQNSPVLKELEFKDVGTPAIKGFESEKIRLYSVEADVSVAPLADMDEGLEKCPNGHGLLHLEQNTQGIYFFKCRFCDYILNEKAESSKKSAA